MRGKTQQTLSHNEKQASHYAKQYASQKIILQQKDVDDLWEWAKYYPLLSLDEFFPYHKGKTLVVICAGSGRELGLFHRHGIRTTATDLTISHLQPLLNSGVIEHAEIQNAERLDFADESFDLGFVNAGLHHLSYPHAGLCELMRVSRECVIFIESQDSILFKIRRVLGISDNDFEAAGNYVYRWTKREIEKFCLSAHAHSFATRTAFLPMSIRMRGINGIHKKAWVMLFRIANFGLAPIGNVIISIIFKTSPPKMIIDHLKKQSYKFHNIGKHWEQN